MTKGHGDCDCIFCNSHCPECNSTEIAVKFKVAYEYENDTKDLITLDQELSEIEVDCQECGVTSQDREWACDKRLHKLERSIHETLRLWDVIFVKYKDDGEIDVSGLNVTSANNQ